MLVLRRLRLQGLHESELRAAAQVRVSIRAPRGAVAELCWNLLDELARLEEYWRVEGRPDGDRPHVGGGFAWVDRTEDRP